MGYIENIFFRKWILSRTDFSLFNDEFNILWDGGSKKVRVLTNVFKNRPNSKLPDLAKKLTLCDIEKTFFHKMNFILEHVKFIGFNTRPK